MDERDTHKQRPTFQWTAGCLALLFLGGAFIMLFPYQSDDATKVIYELIFAVIAVVVLFGLWRFLNRVSTRTLERALALLLGLLFAF
ncbi:MAG TPA: hypothetical protein VHD90_20580, partial [Phototrophicaceae bacterium]|nr:hypothetical protein [Phototrophicaceae bacterium]